MINLLPTESKRQIRAARTNTLLLRYNFLLIGAVIFLLLATGVVFVYLSDVNSNTKKIIAENQSKVSSYSSVQQQAESFKISLASAKQILDKEVSYTKVIVRVTNLLPPGVVLDTLSLDAKTFGTATAFAARAKDYNAALALKNSLQSSPYFSNVYFSSISGGGGGNYPIKVNLNVTIQNTVAK